MCCIWLVKSYLQNQNGLFYLLTKILQIKHAENCDFGNTWVRSSDITSKSSFLSLHVPQNACGHVVHFSDLLKGVNLLKKRFFLGLYYRSH